MSDTVSTTAPPPAPRPLRVAVAQINPTVGDIDGNADLIARDIRRATEAGAELVVFPELAVTGYPPKDLLLKPSFVERCEEVVRQLAAECRDITAAIGYPARSDKPGGLLLYNSAAFCHGGRVAHRHDKSLLPTYDVFDESRYFEPGPETDLTPFPDRPHHTARDREPMQLGISICEDLWNDEGVFSRRLYHDNPISKLADAGADLFVNLSASPFIVRKHGFRKRLISHIAKRYGLPIVYCNQVGGNDELVFDGRSVVYDCSGRLLAQGKGFEEDLLIVDVPIGKPECKPDEALSPTSNAQRPTPTSDRQRTAFAADETDPTPTASRQRETLDEAYHALVLGLGDYCRKCGFRDIVLGLSGGIDSALTACIAVAALGPKHVLGVTMPSRYSSGGSVEDSKVLAQRLGMTCHTVPIVEPHAAFEKLVQPYFEGMEPDATEENIQARCRGVILMAFSNKLGSLLVTTGNKSEMAVGYCTLYGDMAGGLAVLSDVPKTMVYDLSRWINEDKASPLRERVGGPVIPEDTITKPPSAELREEQKDEDSLPPYDELDAIIERYVEREQSASRIIEETGLDADEVLRIVRLIDRNEYKRKQAAPGLKITGRAFGFGRRMPIAQRWRAEAAVETTVP